MKLEDIQRTIDALEEQLQKPFAVIMSQKNFDSLLNEMARQNLIIQKEPLMLSGLRIEAWPYFPEDQVLCVTKDGYEKIKDGHKDLFLKPTLIEFKEINMQEIMKDDSTGEIHVEDTIEDLVPFIKASLAKPDVKYIKIFGGGVGPEKFRAEEEKKNWAEKTFKEPGEEVKK